jgi:phosphohistidine phosphatase
MKRLYLMRHAKTEHVSGKKDFLRELTDRGRKDAEKAGRKLAGMDHLPEKIISSPALRAKETAEIVAAILKGDEQLFSPASSAVTLVDSLYAGTAEEYLQLIKQQGSGDALLLVAHNPSIEQLAEHFERGGAGMSTSEVAWFDFEIETWKELGSESRPKRSDRMKAI